MIDITLTVKLTLQGPILTKSTSAGAYGISSPAARDSQERCYLPGTLVKGRLRQSWEELTSIESLAEKPQIKKWLGDKTGNSDEASKSFAPSRGLLRFRDFIDSSDRERRELYRIAIDEDRGAVRKGAYQSIEAPYRAGEKAEFTGEIQFFAKDDTAANEIRRWVEIGLRWITSLGAERTIGFGRLIGVEVVHDNRSIVGVEANASTAAEIIDLIISPQSPFCIAKRRADNNLFESEVVIPGGVLKGSVATTWLALLGKTDQVEIEDKTDPTRPELCRHFANLRFTHAFPMSDGKRSVVAPLSLIKGGTKEKMKVRDIARLDKPILLDERAPSFDIDWKDRSDVDAEFGWPKLRRELRVRTAIDYDKRKAKDEQLFAYEMIAPGDVTWHAKVDLSRISASERAVVEKQLREILSLGLRGLGKTKARADVDAQPAEKIGPAIQSKSANQEDGVWIVTLQTPALLCDPRKLDGNNSSGALREGYDEAFKQTSNQSLRLKNFYARQSLAGGLYLHRRFQSGRPYNPFLLTDAGSVFILEAIDAATAQQRINNWLAHGLPLPDWARQLYGEDWKTCPYLPTNGYGEIAVNLKTHWEKLPRKGEWQDV